MLEFSPMTGSSRKTDTLSIILFLAFVFFSAFFAITCLDTGFHIRTGEWIVQNRAIPAVNYFSLTEPGHAWHLHHWGASVIIYAVYTLGGIMGLIIFKALLVTALFAVLLHTARKEARGSEFWMFLILTMAVLITRQRFFVRPHLFSALALAILFAFLRDRNVRSGFQFIRIGLLFAVWSNLHAGVIYGFVLTGTFALARWIMWTWQHIRNQPGRAAPWRSSAYFFLGIGISVLTTALINPSGPSVLLLPLKYSLHPFFHNLIIEFLPATGRILYILAGSVILILVLEITGRKKTDPALLATALVFGYLAFRSVRSVLMYTVVTAPYLASLMNRAFRIPDRWKGIPVSWSCIPLWLAIVLFFYLPGTRYPMTAGLIHHHYPMPVYDFMNQKVPAQRLYNDMFFGGSLLWHLYPKFRPFADGRIEAYSDSFWQHIYVPLETGRVSFDSLFQQYGITAALLHQAHGGAERTLIQAIRENPEWHLVAFDEYTRLFLKETPDNHPLIKTGAFHILRPDDWLFSNVNMENADRALAEAVRSARFSADSAFSKAAQARCYFLKGRYDRAADLYESLIHSSYRWDLWWLNRGISLFQAGRMDEAEDVFQKMAAGNIIPGEAWYYLHRLAARRGRLTESSEYLDRALNIQPDNQKYREARRHLDRIGGTP